MILNNNLLYKNYIKQFSKAYIKGSILYVGDNLYNSSCKHTYYVDNLFNLYKREFINLYMTHNNLYEDLNNLPICVICLDHINSSELYKKKICNTCNINVHINCINQWYEYQENRMCPICCKNHTSNYVSFINYLKNINYSLYFKIICIYGASALFISLFLFYTIYIIIIYLKCI